MFYFLRISTGRFLTFLVDRLTAALCIQSSSQHHPPANLHLNTDVCPLRHRYWAGYGGSSRQFNFNVLNQVVACDSQFTSASWEAAGKWVFRTFTMYTWGSARNLRWKWNIFSFKYSYLEANRNQEWKFTSDLNLLFVFCIRNYSHFILDWNNFKTMFVCIFLIYFI